MSGVCMLVVGSCTGRKSVTCDRMLTMDDFRDPGRLRAREAELVACRVPAWRLYAGLQHTSMMNGVNTIRKRFGRESVAVAIVSAGYGLVAEDQLLVPYEATFNEMGRREALAWSRHLGIACDVRAAAKGFPLVVFLLGARYLDALEPPVIPQAGQRFIFLAGSGKEGAVGGPGVTVVGAGREEAATYGSPAIAVKGRMFELFARGFAHEGEALWDRLIADDSPATFMRAVHIGSKSLGSESMGGVPTRSASNRVT